jgi:hypothetical protein
VRSTSLNLARHTRSAARGFPPAPVHTSITWGRQSRRGG